MSAAKHHISGTGDGNSPAEKSKFVNRLSSYLKEKGNIRDINFGINSKFVPNPNPNPNTDASRSSHKVTIDERSSKTKRLGEKSADSVPEYIILDSSSELDDCTIKGSCSEAVTKPKTAQMTIFYGGQVVVIDDVSEDRVKDLIQMVKNSEPSNRIENEISETKESVKGKGKDSSDLPIARRASLHKFLAKRKDRATVRPAPYPQVQHNQSPGGSSSGKEHSFDLNM
ncbi:protein TIFY 10A-like [Rutidosis leptorrhynchoides]|uniref:protein TIFY 10A-like n=1 Tax=Rutidosis leptorrhynchoides TaxID=125765 RepID=UPI003A98D094